MYVTNRQISVVKQVHMFVIQGSSENSVNFYVRMCVPTCICGCMVVWVYTWVL